MSFILNLCKALIKKIVKFMPHIINYTRYLLLITKFNTNLNKLKLNKFELINE